MFILKLMVKLILLPVIIITGFIAAVARILTGVGEFIAGLLIIAAVIMMVYHGIHHDWSQFAYAASVGLMVFTISFMGVLISGLIEWVNRKMMAVLLM
ncbi:MAG: hypothetical protein K6G84_02915 [Lachnospiraceae bacterium]|nr:hypothetical protein [Lachnospiraceae bacterium]